MVNLLCCFRSTKMPALESPTLPPASQATERVVRGALNHLSESLSAEEHGKASEELKLAYYRVRAKREKKQSQAAKIIKKTLSSLSKAPSQATPYSIERHLPKFTSMEISQHLIDEITSPHIKEALVERPKNNYLALFLKGEKQRVFLSSYSTRVMIELREVWEKEGRTQKQIILVSPELIKTILGACLGKGFGCKGTPVSLGEQITGYHSYLSTSQNMRLFLSEEIRWLETPLMLAVKNVSRADLEKAVLYFQGSQGALDLAQLRMEAIESKLLAKPSLSEQKTLRKELDQLLLATWQPKSMRGINMLVHSFEVWIREVSPVIVKEGIYESPILSESFPEIHLKRRVSNTSARSLRTVIDLKV